MAGADLANSPGSVEPKADPPLVKLLPELRRRWSAVRLTAATVLALVTVFALWQGGYPPARIGVIAAVMAGMVAVLKRAAADLTVTAACDGLMPLSVPTVAAGALMLSLVSLTGGLRSPFLPVLAVQYATQQIAFRWTSTTKLLATMHGVGLAALGFAPAWLVGPSIAPNVHAMLAWGAIFVAALINFSVVEVQIRAREAAERALRRARELMSHQMCNRTRELEQVGASLSHELKNPLQAIKILVQLSAREAKEPEARERLRVAAQEVERMQGLIGDYLSFARPLDKLHAEPLDLASIGDEVVAVLSVRAASAGVSLERRGAARVEADPRRVREALHNLVANALEACPQGAKVAVEISEGDDGARIAVRDSGRGMPKDVLERLGTPFFTTRDEGTGLGVALARAVFTQHGGSLRYESNPGTGTVATAILPKKPLSEVLDGAHPHR